MWILEITKNGRELIRAPIEKSSVLIGRSPACDVVLRYPGIRTVHFLIEWTGEGLPKAGDPDWSILDVDAKSGQTQSNSGLGEVLGREKMSVSGFEFRWLFDPLAETQLQKGVLSSRLRQSMEGDQDGGFTFYSEHQVLEIVTVDSERERVIDVQHLPLTSFKQGYRPIRILPQVLMHTPSASRAKFSIERVPHAKAYLRGNNILAEDLKQTVLGPNDLLQIRWNLKDYYLRLVPEVKAPAVPPQIWKDPFYLYSAGALLLLALLIGIVSHIPLEPELREVIPPRIAQVTVRDIPEPLPTVETADAPAPALPAPAPAVVANDAAMTDMLPPKAVAVKPVPIAKAVPKVILPAAKQPVSKMGLLGNLKKSATTPQVRADKILNQGIVSDTASGKGGFVVKQPPSGMLGRQDSKSTGASQASTSDLATERGETNRLGITPTRTESLLLQRSGTVGPVGGGIPRNIVLKRLKAYNREVRNCYERALLVRPSLKGRLTLRWTISATGQTSKLLIMNSQLKMPSLERCVSDTIQAISWPRAANGQPTIVNYPFEFQAQN